MKSQTEREVARVELHRILDQLGEGHFYGEVLIKFEAGNPVFLSRRETLKLTPSPSRQGGPDCESTPTRNDHVR